MRAPSYVGSLLRTGLNAGSGVACLGRSPWRAERATEANILTTSMSVE